MVNETLRTELPDDWHAVNLGNYAQIYRGGSPRPIQDFLTTSDTGVNWIKIGDVSADAKYITSTEEKIIPEGVARSRMVYKGDLVLSNSMSYGRPYILNIDGCIHDGWLVIQKYEKTFDRGYLYYALSSDQTMQQYITIAAGSSVQNLNKEKVSKVVLPCPSIPEQEKIAEILSDIDALIADLQKLIQKKKDIRRGSLQFYLNDTERYEWVECSITELLKPGGIKIGPFGSQLKKEMLLSDGLYKVYGQENVYENDFSIGGRFLTPEHFQRLNSCEIIPGDFLMSTMGTIGKCSIVPEHIQKGIMDSHLIRLRFDGKKIEQRYILYLFSDQFDYLKRQTQQLSVGGIMEGLSVGIVSKLMVRYPKKAKEQREIIEIFDDMNLEIGKLEEKLSKYQKVKQGMMEELLTGKVRLV
ncbi:restriction endonuclease subunit S [Solobacterium moorei]|uniref:restriction endonuclease subunit S n=1 Tax=Solobacterium moorei TaxID=102148 RepID=UPI0028F16157|nr:restriction endonuclease subunit S [Solobacterium moorei]